MKLRISLLTTSILFLFFLSSQLNAITNLGDWKELKPIGGIGILSLAKHPSGKIFAGTLYNGIYASSDEGQNWKQVHYYRTATILEQFPSIASDNSGIIYAAAYSDGVYVSRDAGDTWDKLDFPKSEENVLTVNTDESGRLFVSTGYGLWLSNDQGKSWNKIFDTYDKINDSHIAVRSVAIQDGVIYAAADFAGLFISEDLGKSWSFSRLPGSAYYSLAIKNRNEIFVAMNYGLWFLPQGVFRTKNGGISWEDVTRGLSTDQIYSLKFNKDGALLAGGNYGRLFKSDDDGNTWITELSEQTLGTINSILVSGDKIYTGHSGTGVMIKETGLQWKSLNNGFPSDKIRTVTKLTNGNVLVGTASGIFRYDPKTESYTSCNKLVVDGQTNIMGPSPSTEFDNIIETNDKSLIANTFQGTFWKSFDNGQSWNFIRMPYSPEVIMSCKQLNDGIYFYSAGNDEGLFRSIDRGETWEKITKDIIRGCQTITSDKNNRLYAAISTSLKYSSDIGKSWNYYQAVDGHIIDALILGNGSSYVLTDNFLYRSSDNGSTWSKNSFKNEASGYLLFMHKIYSTSQGLLLTTERGLYFSTDNGIRWQKSDDKLQTMNVKSLLPQSDGSIYSITDQGTYYLEPSYIPTNVKNESIPTKFVLQQNFPNPFNPETTIEYSIPAQGVVSIRVFDIIGREIITLVNEEKSPGNYSVKLNGSSLPSGIYFYRMQCGSFTETKKLMLVK